jgi:riboflavin synthase alpha subunit
MNRLVIRSFVVLGLLTGACGRTSRAPASTGAIVQGIVAAPAGVRVAVAGTSLSSATDSRGSFVLLGVPAGAASLYFSGGGAAATLPIGVLLRREHRRVVVSASGSDAHEDMEQGETRFVGAVERIDSPSLTVSGRKVTITSLTQFKRSGAAITLADVHIGDRVEVEGTPQADQSVLARTITVEQGEHEDDDGVEDGHHDVEFKGTLTAIAGSKLTVNGVSVTISASTVIESGDAKIDASKLAVGQRLKVEGDLQADKSVAATEIHVLAADRPEDMHVAGAVTAIDAAARTLTVGNSTVRVDAATRFDDVKSLADLKIGDMVDIEASRAADGTLLAREIHRLRGPPPPAHVEVRGAITAIDAAGLTVQSKLFAVDAGTRMESHGRTFKLSDLKIGDTVEVHGVARADGSLVATRIKSER